MVHITDLVSDDASKIIIIAVIVVVVIGIGCITFVCIGNKKKRKNRNKGRDELTEWTSADEQENVGGQNANPNYPKNIITEKSVHSMSSIDAYQDEILKEMQNIKNKQCEQEMQREESISIDI